MTITEHSHRTAHLDTLRYVGGRAYDKELALLSRTIKNQLFYPYLLGRLNGRTADTARFAADMGGFGASLTGTEIELSEHPAALDVTIPTLPEKNDLDGWHTFVNGFYVAATARVVLLLQALGVYTRQENPIQLSLGAGNGVAEQYGMHVSPLYRKHGRSITLDNQLFKPSHLYLVDHQAPEKTEQNEHITTIIDDAVESLTPSTIARPATLVTMLRMAPDLYSQVELLFDRLASVMDTEADLIVTIGSGNTLAEFNRRREKIHDLRDYLAARGFHPTLLDLTDDRGQDFPIWGFTGYTHHAVLHCRLVNVKR